RADDQDEDEEPAGAAEPARPGRRGHEAHESQEEQLAARRRLLAELLHGLLELVRPPFGLGERRLHHLAERRALLRVHARERLVEVLACGGGVVALRGAGPEEGASRGAVLRL